MKAKELMSAPAIAVFADASLREIVRLLISQRIHSVPVVDHNGQVIGVVSRRHLFPSSKYIRSPEVRVPVLFQQIIDLKRLVSTYQEFAHFGARDVMSPRPTCVDVNDDIENIAWLMVEEDLHMTPVLSEGKLVGVLSRSDFIQLLVLQA